MSRRGISRAVAWGLAGLFWTVGCATAPAPEELRGTWESATPGYEDRTMRIAADSVWFGNGSDVPSAHPVRDAYRSGEEIVIEYGRDRAVYQLRLVQPGDGSIRLKNQQNVIWRPSP